MHQLQDFLQNQVPKTDDKKFPGELGLKRMQHFMNVMHNPQERIKIIHIAGTSGKGSTAKIAATILQSLGVKVGLHISPHIIDLTERYQISGIAIDVKKLCQYLTDIIPYIEEVRESEYGPLTYFEIVTGLAFYIFYKEQVDYAVIETGMGGWLDATNVVENENKVAIITRLGFDHTEILGNTIEQIAFQKGMIMHPHVLVFSVMQDKDAIPVLNKIAEENNTNVIYIAPGINTIDVSVQEDGTHFTFSYDKLKEIQFTCGLVGEYQAENASLALAAIWEISKRDGLNFDVVKVKKSLSNVFFPGRFEIIKAKDKKYVVDGAHNPQKMEAFLNTFRDLYPNTKAIFLLAFKEGKDFEGMVDMIIPYAQRIIISEFSNSRQDLMNKSIDPQEIKTMLQENNFKNWEIISSPSDALHTIEKGNASVVVITGSLYFISMLYPDLRILKGSK